MRAARTIACWVALVGVVVAAVGCGLAEDGSPEAIAPDNVPPDLLDPNPPTSSTLPGSPDTSPVTVYFLDERAGEDNVLTAVEREVVDPTRPGPRIEALLNQPPTEEESEDGVFTSIPSGVRLLDTDLNQSSQVLRINLSQELFDIEGRELSNAFAQMVWTAAELDGVRQVRFQVDGEDIQARDDEGSERSVVNTGDYRSLAPVG